MGFNSVYRCLQEIFPMVDSRLLRAVAIENSKDADQAALAVLSEIIPYFSLHSIGPSNPPENDNGIKKQMDLLSQQQVIVTADVGPSLEPCPIACDDAKETDHSSGVLHADAKPIVEALNESTVSDIYDANKVKNQPCGCTENDEVILLENAMLHGGKNYQKQFCGYTKDEDLISRGNGIKIGLGMNPPDMTTALINEKGAVKVIANDLDLDRKDFDFPMDDDSNMVVHGECQKEELCLVSSEVRKSVPMPVPTSIKEHTLFASGSSDLTFRQDYFDSEMNGVEDEPKPDTIVTHSDQECKIHLVEEIIVHAKNNKKELNGKQMKLSGSRDENEGSRAEVEASSTPGNKSAEESTKPSEPPKQDYIHVRARKDQATVSHSLAERVRRESERMKILQDLVPGCNKVTGKVVVLDETINYIQSLQRQVEFLSMKLGAVNSRMGMNPAIEGFPPKDKTLLSAMERVIDMMREMDFQEKAAEQAKAEACQGGLDILVRVEEMKQMLAHAKEANNMHAGEVYGEKTILATEVRELQSRLLSMSDERDGSLAILDEMHLTLEARVATAEELRKAAEQERIEKEESAQNALAVQEAIMEKVVQESKMLEDEAEENSRLREFLMDRGRIVDTLQGELSVICQDVRLLKEKFDNHVPLSQSFSSSQTSCILATTEREVYVKNEASDLVPEQRLASSGSSLKSAAAVPKTISPTTSVDSLSVDSRIEKERARAEHQALLDEGWDFLDTDAELQS
ncbi:uncharacterized protein LOC121263657 isoform X1 [Juglans microcarpa x Juglans regia]|uniref:uncharacterized protein LOC121263657 isoform X1 n=1 Tax=Juglans microcarpa x Juglans regia TaxID=2249226 RepID=UPI001B7F078D|nr:uncharacterized protein LOC121263657 isoform X1 [Juglans microcarpa x Juglans regia]XP_041022617.1 uncharacterized protein LOC121263657 isoform X1 [Juglans microcarpa x Juglans regia]XP_041022618.1 uncharacterized protein LOC121263657 isoform X1 [Juglans microcarpa x Juglans regia]XP_041022619.1 uncharacterized protein LOC121263657 isoform X1 [Juglans microcarpa x Juglans regia]